MRIAQRDFCKRLKRNIAAVLRAKSAMFPNVGTKY